ncbi:hypothetical protein JET18_01670 [Chryseobacterium sp. L7]|uniref:TonB C-terminal domain-containing protein n=1 Tax=Chryseobacterium endalhagicum TaxID=2797638 RepID=A0ABS1QA93_9FLAO|nr:hypothetical protein [Chryseobacterium endalhagicum]MBL1219525.1 hypothetical protein [Chryseobacterium endalhagicum]
MKKIALLSLTCMSAMAFSQNKKTNAAPKIADRYESRQQQDPSVPPPPTIAFPAQFPGGNKAFVKKVEQNLNKEALTSLSKTLNTQIILKIDQEGNVLNISTYGKDEIFNSEVKAAAISATDTIKWTAGKNNRGEKVIDIVKIPFRYKRL